MITEEELEFRKGKIGASSCAAALGVSRWQTKAELYCEVTGLVKPDDLGERGQIGNDMEPVIIKAYERATGIKVHQAVAPIHPNRPSNAPPGTFIHPQFPWMIAHLDGVMPDYEMILEIKNVGVRMVHDWGLDGDPEGPPIYVQSQVTQQAILADVERVDVAAFFGGNELRVYPMEITENAKRLVLDGLVSFWEDHIVRKIQPEVTGLDLDLLKKLYPGREKDKIIKVESTESAIAFQQYREFKEKLKRDTEMCNAMKAKLIDFMGDATVIQRGEDYEFTYRKTKDKEVVDYQGGYEDLQDFFARDIEINGMSGNEFLKWVLVGNTAIKKGHRIFNDKAK